MGYDASWDDNFGDGTEEVGTSQEEYVPSSSIPAPPPMGKYDVRGVPDKFVLGNKGGVYIKGATVEIVGGEHDGRKADAFISGFKKPWRETGTDLDDFLAGGGLKPANGKKFTVQEIGAGVEATWTNIRKAYINHEGFCKSCGKTVASGANGYKKENKDGFRVIGFADKDGKIQPAVRCPICGEVVRARAKVARWYVD